VPAQHRVEPRAGKEKELLVGSNPLFCAVLFRATSRIRLPSPCCPQIQKPTPETRPPVGGTALSCEPADSLLIGPAKPIEGRFLEANRSPHRA
jgi:hypothetical protein